MSGLNWRTVTRSNDPQFMVTGAVLSTAIFGPHSRYKVYEIRTVARGDNGLEYDRKYVVRDAEQVSDADLKAGKRPPVVGQTDDYERLLAFVAKVTLENHDEQESISA